jgi:hypothetical protein
MARRWRALGSSVITIVVATGVAIAGPLQAAAADGQTAYGVDAVSPHSTAMASISSNHSSA